MITTSAAPSIIPVSIILLIFRHQFTVAFQCDNGISNVELAQHKLCDGIKDCVDNSDESAAECLSVPCNNSIHFKCLYGACIGRHMRCDGEVNCHDFSDEVECCTNNGYLCGPPNHCIDIDLVCNGNNDCDNKRDELDCTCSLPNEAPNNTVLYVLNDDNEISPGTKIDIFVPFIEYNCTDGFTEISESWRQNYCEKNKLGKAQWKYEQFLGCAKTCSKSLITAGQFDTVVCLDKFKKTVNCYEEPYFFPGSTVQYVCIAPNSTEFIAHEIECDDTGHWTGSTPNCTQMLPTQILINDNATTCNIHVLDRPSLRLICLNELGKVIDCYSTTISAGTKVKILCNLEYYSDNEVNSIATCDRNGQWTVEQLPTCRLICGEQSGRSIQTAMSDGIPTSTDIYPWVAAIYRNSNANEYEYICGGNIISAKLVISAAHCFVDEDANYVVVVGKTLRQFNDANEKRQVQRHEIDKMKDLGDDYIGEDDYHENDIIVLVLKTYIRFNVHIKPVCIDMVATPAIIKENLYNLDHGHIAGWGTMENGSLSDTLIYNKYPIVSNCRSVLHDRGLFDQSNFLTVDKFCAGSFGFSTVCSGDSGHGLVFERLTNGRIRYFLYGVLSMTGEMCDQPSYGLYTNVQSFKNQIKKFMDEYRD